MVTLVKSLDPASQAAVAFLVVLGFLALRMFPKATPVRVRLGSFLPSNGVGTAFSRAALESLAERRNGRVFDPECLTEDYEIGFALHAAGARQAFLPVRYDAAGPIATREYFPRRFGAAVRQRSRWVAGIALQGWERHGWRAPWKQRYWLWRDRKGLVGNLISPLANVMGVYGFATLIVDGACGRAWTLRDAIPEWLECLAGVTFCISAVHMGMKAHISANVYGWRFGAAAPLRVFWANFVNCAATLSGLRQYAQARLRRRALAWNKTEHIYPAKNAPEYMAH
jgi:adsorption protein B